MAIHLLKRSEVEKLARTKPPTGKRLTHDGDGLFFRVATSKTKDPDKTDALVCSWVFRFRDVAGKTREMGLGPYPRIDLIRAREKAQEARSHKDALKDPIEVRESERAALLLQRAKQTTFRDCWKEFWKGYASTLRNKVHRQQWENTLEAYVLPIVGDLTAGAVDTQLVLKVLQQPVTKANKRVPLWTAIPESARRIRARIEMILDWAKLHGHREGENPARWAGHLEHALGGNARPKRKHHASMAWQDVPAFMAKLRGEEDISGLALEFTILTVNRTSPVIGMDWKELKEADAVWTVPGERMKGGTDFRVPLSPAAMAVLRKMKKLTGGEGYVFPGREQGQHLSNMAMLKKLERMGHGDMTVHGYRSSFRTWVSETRKHDNDLGELALAHAERDQTVAAYNRTDQLEKRRPLMNAWATFCGKGDATAKVVRIGQA